MIKLTALLLTVATIAFGQNGEEKLFVHNTPREFRRHFSPQPKDIETAIFQIDTYFTAGGRNYFKQLPEKLAALQFEGTFRFAMFTWKMRMKSTVMYSPLKNSVLVDYFIAQGGTGGLDEMIRVITMALHRKLNNKPFAIAALQRDYGDGAFSALRDSIRDVHPSDTLFGSWFVPKRFFRSFAYSAGFEVLSNDDGNLLLRVLTIQINNKSVEQVESDKIKWKVGDVIPMRNRQMRNWKEVINYPPLDWAL